jgi:MFS family permease
MTSLSTSQIRPLTIAVFLLALLFLVFFQITKQIPALAQVNPFGEDPYDAVGSFGIQVTLVAALLSFLRVLRPYRTREIITSQYLLILRGNGLSVISVAVTLVVDLIAMVRYSDSWIHYAAGKILAILVVGIMILTALTGWWFSRVVRRLQEMTVIGEQCRKERVFTSMVLIVISCAITLAIYPPGWRQSLFGGIFTALAGMLILMILLAGLKFMGNQIDDNYEDVFNDLAAVWRGISDWIRKRATWLVPILDRLDAFFVSRSINLMVSWLNPRRHPWRMGMIISMGLGLGLVITQTIGEGLPSDPSHFLLVSLVLFGGEAFGVMIGYLLFGKYLGIYRDER